MKKIIFLISIFISILSMSFTNHRLNVESPIPIQDTIIGFFNFDQLKTPPYNAWFDSEYENYSVDTNTLNQLNDQLLENVTITVVMGTWCSDSQREIPRFVKILKYMDFDLDQVTAIGVDRKKQASGTPVNELNIEYVPTIIFFRDDIEIGRIIESPEQSLEIDMLKIILGA